MLGREISIIHDIQRLRCEMPYMCCNFLSRKSQIEKTPLFSRKNLGGKKWGERVSKMRWIPSFAKEKNYDSLYFSTKPHTGCNTKKNINLSLTFDTLMQSRITTQSFDSSSLNRESTIRNCVRMTSTSSRFLLRAYTK